MFLEALTWRVEGCSIKFSRHGLWREKPLWKALSSAFAFDLGTYSCWKGVHTSFKQSSDKNIKAYSFAIDAAAFYIKTNEHFYNSEVPVLTFLMHSCRRLHTACVSLLDIIIDPWLDHLSRQRAAMLLLLLFILGGSYHAGGCLFYQFGLISKWLRGGPDSACFRWPRPRCPIPAAQTWALIRNYWPDDTYFTVRDDVAQSML